MSPRWCPVDESIVSPAGSAPALICQCSGASAVVSLSGWGYATSIRAAGSVVVVIRGLRRPMLIVTGSVAVSVAGLALSVTRALNDAVPAAAGVPVILPAESSVNPAGSDPETTDHA